MRGNQITFFTQQDRRHQGKLLGEWLVLLARELNLPGATLIAGSEGFGYHRRIHSSHFFELADQPQEIHIAVNEEDTERLFVRLKKEAVHLF